MGVAFLERSPWDTNLLLLAAPWAWLVLALAVFLIRHLFVRAFHQSA